MTYLIAETGINHGGDPDRLNRLVHLAADSGFDAVKFQLWDWWYISRPEAVCKSLKPLQLLPASIFKAAGLGKQLGLDVIVSVFTRRDLDTAEKYPIWTAYKLSHIESQDAEFVEKVKATGKRVILSSRAGTCLFGGGLYMYDQKDVLWCCPDYPTAVEDVDWDSLKDYAGFSDHTGNRFAGAAAAECGAKIIEAHITDHKDGPDAAVSIDDPATYVMMVRECAKEAEYVAQG